MRPALRRGVAVAYGVACHGSFLLAVGLMARGLYTGMRGGAGTLQGRGAILADALLLVQFPLLHSVLLTRAGRRVLGALAPPALGRSLAPTTYALIAALQIAATFGLWSPVGPVLWEPGGIARVAHVGAFAASWTFLATALAQAGLGLQTGWVGWTSVWRGRKPRYPGLPERGLFARCRQPIYLGFALVLWTGPTWTLDHLAIALTWGTYCAVGPLLKERRFAAIYGMDFAAYRRRVPYFLPRLFS